MEVLISLFLFSLTCVSAILECPKCGIMDVPDPLSTSDKCGNPSYRIHCKNGSLEFLSAEGIYYKILSINPNAFRLIISSLMQKDTCHSLDLSVGGLRIDENSPFNISSRNTVMLLNCSERILLSPLNCSLNSPCRKFENEFKDCRDTVCCSYLKVASKTSHRIRVRVGGCTAYTSVVDLKAGDPINAWKYGVELQWLSPK
ncbi:wall-associated receptor kinase-like 20 [Nicotiana tabacum]|uniref:Wall-associated receptor kinase-like 20 n=2 Tax=Nicotiana TaxID=4085 RepID=A0A1S3Z2B7_TOBAC|nr:PREDICTED: wall-associated receptor kinase-like 20 [Nicotiana sylvestris]XP_016458302.1 PREDICTED: wall-associated receptor kinase-like 20 [Nicotiana tabacum]